MSIQHSLKTFPGIAVMLGAMVLPATVYAQQPESPVFKVQVTEYVQRSTDAVNYRHRSGATKIDFAGTPLLPKASGEAKVESKQGYIEIEVEFDELKPATQYGPEFLTYVMWAITPEGRATNLGEVILNGNRSKLNVTTELQSFGLVVTAEPYFAVTVPSDVVVMENVIRDDTKGRVETIRASYDLLKRGQYSSYVDPQLLARREDKKAPLDLLQADNAVRIARGSGADQYANEAFARAVQAMNAAEGYYGRKEDKSARMRAREAVQMAEDARLLAVQRAEEARLAEERRLAEQKTAETNRLAAQEAQNRREAEMKAQLAASERARAEDQARIAADQARQAAADAQRSAALKAEADAARVAAENARQAADAARLKAEAERTAAAQEADRLARERAAAEAARAEALAAQEAAQRQAQAAQLDAQNALAARQAAERDAQQARDLAAKADQERAELRDRLQRQLNMVLETKQTARGLIVNMSDVLFDVDRATLKPGAREKLAKVAGILMTHPDLAIKAEGHTDSTGGDEYNQRLSEQRATSVSQFLVSQGIPAPSIEAKGFGETLPVASNDTAAGRQQNRRVELVISGESIQAPSSTSASNR